MKRGMKNKANHKEGGVKVSDVEKAVERAVARAVPAAVDKAIAIAVPVAVDKAIATAVPVAVDKAIATAVPMAVDKAIATAVPMAVDAAFERAKPSMVEAASAGAAIRLESTLKRLELQNAANMERIAERAADLAVTRITPILDRIDLQNQAAFDRIAERATEEATHRTKVMVEQLQGQIGAVVDALEANERHLNRRMDDLEGRLTRRIEVLEVSMKLVSDDVRKNSNGLERLAIEIAQMRESLRAPATREELLKLEARVEELETRAGVSSKPD